MYFHLAIMLFILFLLFYVNLFYFLCILLIFFSFFLFLVQFDYIKFFFWGMLIKKDYLIIQIPV